jgi:hypothetical protein
MTEAQSVSEQNIRQVVDALKDNEPDQLVEDFGLRLQAIDQGLVDPNRVDPGLPAQAQNFDLSAARAFGARFFRQVAREAYPIICTTDNPDRAAFQKVLPNVSDAATLLSGILISSGVAVPFVAPVAALIIIKVVARPTLEAFCQGLKDAIDKDEAPA